MSYWHPIEQFLTLRCGIGAIWKNNVFSTEPPIDEESFVKIARNSWQAKVIARSMHYQTLQTDKNLARNYSTTKLV
jgi:hypothetical protein